MVPTAMRGSLLKKVSPALKEIEGLKNFRVTSFAVTF